MFGEELIITIRNILLVQLVMVSVSLAPERAVLVRQEFLKIWKSLNAPFLPKKTDKGREKFWEIDMTKFEP